MTLWYHTLENIIEKNRKIFMDKTTEFNSTTGEKFYNIIEKIRLRGNNLLENETKTPIESKLKWLNSLVLNGAKNDKITAAASLVKLSPVKNIFYLDMLLEVVLTGFNKEKTTIIKVLYNLQDLFISSLLPNRKLLFLEQQTTENLTFCNHEQGDRLLVYLYFEDCIKRRFIKFVKNLAKVTQENVDYIKDKSLNVAFNLFYKKPEQEKCLLAILINKLGDPNKKIASKTGYLILNMLNKHPKIIFNVENELKKILTLPNIKNKTIFNIIYILNQIIYINKTKFISPNNRRTSSITILLDKYFKFLYRLTKRKLFDKTIAINGVSSINQSKYSERKNTKKIVSMKLASILLLGLKQMFSILNRHAKYFLNNINVSCLFSLVDLLPSVIGYQALVLLYQLRSFSQISIRLNDVLYNALTSNWIHLPHMAVTISVILLRILRKEVSTKYTIVFLKRILLITISSETPLACCVLIIISELLRTHKTIWIEIPQITYDRASKKVKVTKSIIESEWKKLTTKEKSTKVRPYLLELLLVGEHYNPIISSMSRSLMCGLHIAKFFNPVSQTSPRHYLEAINKL